MPLGKKNGIVVQTCFSIFLQSKMNATNDISAKDRVMCTIWDSIQRIDIKGLCLDYHFVFPTPEFFKQALNAVVFKTD